MSIKEMTREREKKAIAVEVKADSQGRIEGYASRFNEVDQGMDMVAPSAFSASISQKMPKMLWQHDAAKPIGRWMEASEDETGLYLRGEIIKGVEQGREAMSLVEAGIVDGLSIGFMTRDFSYIGDGVRILKEVDLWEVSLVTFPMQTSARIDSIKAAEMSRREMEALLTQDAGLSRSVARSLMDGGMGAVKAMQDAGGSGFDELAQFMRQISGKGDS